MAFPYINASHQWVDTSGSPLVGGTMEFRDPTSNNLINTYPTADDADAQTNANDNPFTLDARGGYTGIYLEDGVAYKMILKDSLGATVDTQDDVLCPNGNPTTAAETSAGVTVVNPRYEPGNVLRYGTNTTPGTTDMTTAIQSAIDVIDGTAGGGVVYFPAGEYLVTSALTYQQTGTSAVNPGVSFIGDGRSTSKITYSGTSGFCLNIKGATGMAVSATGRLGLVEGITVSGLGFTGTGESSGNTDGGIYVQGFNHFELIDCLITEFGQDGIHLDRLYYSLAPDATLDDRAAFASLRHSEISNCGRTSVQAGGINSATDYSIDHLYTENLHIVGSTTTGMKAYVQNWTDNGSLFAAGAVGLHLYAQNTDILSQEVVMIGSRFEGGESDCMLKIDSCLSGAWIGCSFTGHAGPLPATQVKISTDATYNVGYVTFQNCIHQQATTAYDLVSTGAITNVRIVDPRFGTVTTEVANALSDPCQMIKGPSWERVTGGGAVVSLDGIAGDVLTSSLTGDSARWLDVSNTAKTIQLGNGAVAPDAAMKRLSNAAQSNAAMTFDVPISAQNTQAFIHAGSGTPESAVAAAIGSLFLRTDGGANTTLYVKESGAGTNTGWIAK